MAGRTAWYPGHMAKGKRELENLLGSLDLVVEVRDARAPMLTASNLSDAFSKKSRVWIALTKTDLAERAVTDRWVSALSAQGHRVFPLDLKNKRAEGLKKALRQAGPSHRGARLAVFGIPNVGKSQLLNALVGKKAAPVGGIPGLTRGVSWYQGDSFLVVDSPGILDPKAGAAVEQALAWLGCSKVEVIGGYEALGLSLLQWLLRSGHWSLIQNKWGVSPEGTAEELMEQLGRRLGCLVSGGLVDRALVGRRLIDGFSTGKFGPFSLERPEALFDEASS